MVLYFYKKDTKGVYNALLRRACTALLRYAGKSYKCFIVYIRK